ncbi:hypothetical protein LguiB_001368 [Lonicera macranthoides]
MERETLRSCSEKEKKRKKNSSTSSSSCSKRGSEARGLVRCSFSDKEEEEEKKKKKKKTTKTTIKTPLATRVTKTTTTSISISMIIPPEDPNHHINLYLCLKTRGSRHHGPGFQWCKIDPTNTDVEDEDEDEDEEEDSNSNSKFEPKPKRRFLTPISTMPTTTPHGFRAIPHSSSNQKKKLVYAVGSTKFNSSLKAFVCDFGATPVWEELPPMPRPIHLAFGLASPLNGNVYAFGIFHTHENNSYTGLVFEPASRSWNPCPHPFNKYRNFFPMRDCALVHTRHRNEFIVFGTGRRAPIVLDLTTGNWKPPCFSAPAARIDTSSSVAVGDVIYRFNNSRLSALNLAFKRPFFKKVYGLEEVLPTIYGTVGLGHIAYLGKGKLCIVWGLHDLHVKDPFTNPITHITCLKFWVGVCNQTNQLRAVVDRCEHYAAHGLELYEFMAF